MFYAFHYKFPFDSIGEIKWKWMKLKFLKDAKVYVNYSQVLSVIPLFILESIQWIY